MGRYVGWPSSDEVEELLGLAQKGDVLAQERLLASLRSPLLAYFTYRLPADIAEDMAQIALIRISRAIPRIDPARAERYVITVARNLLRTAYRRRARDRRSHVDERIGEFADSRIEIDLDLEYRDLAAAVEQIVPAALPPPLARIVLGLLHGETRAEIAADQGVSPITIRTRLIRARAVLRRKLKAYIEAPEPQPNTRPEENPGQGRRRTGVRRCRGL